MEMIGLDLHKRESQLFILAEDGESVDRRIIIGRAAFSSTIGDRPRGRILLEASTETEWGGAVSG